ncbi:TetR/AcrR family transcriptional regulator (plasmid) [Sphingobium sp. V4]|uniref:TetR/AcrR family transcriptional regulator n=1 Tax=Sphingobium sp. V4 TaxID=3038927 RepID=UPI00255828BF|nr:TetR/AcrR family transcriptional regulator [Sphingobium sp. V4]WIW90325.1 TetR/AcrR family transcriptional regulator [Sphingobium sp. V4]
MSAQRERILRGTIACISRKGVEGMSLADIRKECALSTGAIYTHFSNKEEIVAEALRYGLVSGSSFPEDWLSFKRMIVNLDDQLGFDIATVVKTRLHLRAECANPGRLHDLYKPILEEALETLCALLTQLEAKGEITLKAPARQTALAISSFIDGMLWTALAMDRPLSALTPELAAGIDNFVEPKKAAAAAPHVND